MKVNVGTRPSLTQSVALPTMSSKTPRDCQPGHRDLDSSLPCLKPPPNGVCPSPPGINMGTNVAAASRGPVIQRYADSPWAARIAIDGKTYDVTFVDEQGVDGIRAYAEGNDGNLHALRNACEQLVRTAAQIAPDFVEIAAEEDGVVAIRPPVADFEEQLKNRSLT